MEQEPALWHAGQPPHPWNKEWFIAETTYGDRIVLTALPKSFSYDYKTADGTYIKAELITRWMQFPDSEYVPFAAPMPQVNESEAVKVLRELVRLHKNRQYIGDCPEGWVQAIEHARAVLAGEPGANGEQSTGKKDLQVQQPEQTQVMDERELFHAWFDTYADPHSGRVERNIKRKAAWDAWQARAALAQAQASGKAAPTIDRNAIIEECAMVCEKEADDYQERESLKYAECRSDAEQGCRTCQYAILELKDAPKDGTMAAGQREALLAPHKLFRPRQWELVR